MIHIVVAVAQNGCIGRDGHMPWHCPEELALFKSITMGHTLLMGRSTWESIHHPLPGRKILVATQQASYETGHKEVTCCQDLIALCKQYETSKEILMVCGGAQLYQFALPFAHEISFSVMKEAFDGDTYFPMFSYEAFDCEDIIQKEAFTYYHLKKKEAF